MIGSLFDLVHDGQFQKWAHDAKRCGTNRERLELGEIFWRGHAFAAGVPVSVYSHVLHEIVKTREIYERAGSLNDPRY